MPAIKPLLTLCLLGRNDDYMPDFLYRMSMTINFLGHSLEKIDRVADVELLVVDWKSKKPLLNSLSLSEAGARITKFIHVHPNSFDEDAEAETFDSYAAVNTGFKNAAGTFIGCCGADTIIPQNSILALLRVLSGNSSVAEPNKKVFFCGRFDIPFNFVDTAPNIPEWERFLRLNSWNIEAAMGNSGFLSGNAGLFLAHKDIIRESKGYYEKIDPFWGWADIELNFRLMGYFPCYDLLSSGVLIYNMGHNPDAGSRVKKIKKMPPFYLVSPISANEDKWGEPVTKIEISQAISSAYTYGKAASGKLIIELPDPRLIKRVSEFVCRYEQRATAKETWGSIEEFEQLQMLVLASLFGQMQITRYCEIGCRKSKLMLFAASLYNHLEITGMDLWGELDYVSGPQCISYSLYNEPADHRGNLRLMNRSPFESIATLAEEDEDHSKYDVVVVSERFLQFSSDKLCNIFSILTQAGVLIFSGTGIEYFQDLLDEFEKYSYGVRSFRKGEQFVIVASQALMDLEDITHQVHCVKLEQGYFVDAKAYKTVTSFYKALESIPQGDVILYGFGSIGKLVLPVIKERVVAIVDRDLRAGDVTSVEGVNVIGIDAISQFPDATVVITSTIYDDQIRAELTGFNNFIYTLSW